MSVSLTSKIPQLAKDIENAVARSVALGAAELGRNIKEMLSKPGRGRVYVRKTNAKTNYLGFNRSAYKEALKSKGFRRLIVGKRSGDSTILQGRFAFISRSDAAAMLRARRSRGNRNRSLRSMGFHKASAPGSPPAVDTGNLRRSWQTAFQSATPGKVGNKYRVSIGTNLPYAAYLEFGTRSIRERPYIRPAAAAFRPRMQQIVSEQLDRVLAKYRGKR